MEKKTSEFPPLLTPVAEKNALILERTIERKNKRIRNDSFIIRDETDVKKSIRLGMRRGLPARRETGETRARFCIHQPTEIVFPFSRCASPPHSDLSDHEKDDEEKGDFEEIERLIAGSRNSCVADEKQRALQLGVEQPRHFRPGRRESKQMQRREVRCQEE